MITQDQPRTSQRYAVAQTVLLCGYAAAILLDRGALLFASVGGRMAGNVLCGAGILLMFSAFPAIRDAVQIAPEPKPNSQLATTGVYRFLRHPIYTAIVLNALGIFLRKPTLLSLVAGGVVVAFLLIKVRFEEARLLAVYPEYAAYKKKVCGIVPGW